MNNLEQLKKTGQAPNWLGIEGMTTLSKGYLVVDKNGNMETPRDAYQRMASQAAKILKRPDLEPKFFNAIWNGWLCPSSPVFSNFGTTRGLPVSCFGQAVPDSVDGIFQSVRETALLTKHGGGIGKYYGNVRAANSSISGNGKSEGVVPWLKIEEAVIGATAQGGTRRGAEAIYTDIHHGDIKEFIEIRNKNGDPSRKCLSNNFHIAVNLTDEFMNDAIGGSRTARDLWKMLMLERTESGEPYFGFMDTANRAGAKHWHGRKILQSQLCNEIFSPSDDDHTFTCVLSSLNLAKWEEWKDTDLIELSIYFLDAVNQEFIDRGRNIPGLEKAVRFAEASRSLGLGVLGWATLLQEKGVAFDSFQSNMLNNMIFQKLEREAEAASEKLAIEYGPCAWDPTGKKRNTTVTAIAPTLTNSILAGGVGQGVEPITANVYSQNTAKGVFLRKNPTLQALLNSKGKDTLDIWSQINSDRGSVKNIDCLSVEEKEVFLTAREINQFAIVRQAGQRQKYISHGQSINLFFAMPKDIKDTESKEKLQKYIHDVHLEAWKVGLKGLYYMKTESVLQGDSIYRDASSCASCEG